MCKYLSLVLCVLSPDLNKIWLAPDTRESNLCNNNKINSIPTYIIYFIVLSLLYFLLLYYYYYYYYYILKYNGMSSTKSNLCKPTNVCVIKKVQVKAFPSVA